MTRDERRRTLRRTLLGALLVALATLVLADAGRPAMAAPPHTPTLEIIVIHAVQSGPAGSVGSIDRELHDLLVHAKEKPFASYNVFRQLDRKLLPLDRPISYALANGRSLQVTLGSVLADAGEKRYQLETQISETAEAGTAPFLKGHVTASANEPFWIAGQSFQGGTLVLELVVRL